jgi:hypothetical protein
MTTDPGTLSAPASIDARGARIVHAADGIGAAIDARGTIAATGYVLDAAVARGERTLTMTATVTDIEAGDIVLLSDDTARVSDGATGVNLEVHQVSSVAGDTIVLVDQVAMPKSVSATANVRLLTPLRGVEIAGPLEIVGLSGGTSGSGGVRVQYCAGPSISSLTATQTLAPAVWVAGCIGARVSDIDVSAPADTGGGQGYGVLVNGGSAGSRLERVTGHGLRHTVDLGGSIRTHVVDSTDTETAVGPGMVLSHQGWDADAHFEDCACLRSGNLGFNVSAQGVASGYDLRAYGMRVTRGRVQIRSGLAYGYGFASDMPLEDCDIAVDVTYEDGTAVGTATRGASILPQDHLRSRVEVTTRAVQFGVYLTHGAARTPGAAYTRSPLRVSVTSSDAAYGIIGTDVTALAVERLDLTDPTNFYILLNKNSGGPDLAFLEVSGVRIEGGTASKAISLASLPASGVQGRLGDWQDTATDGIFQVGNGYSLTLNDIAGRSRGGVILIQGAGVGYVLGTDPLPVGAVEGQRLTLVNPHATRTLGVPDGANNANIGGGTITLAAAGGSATWVWAGGLWRQIA